MVYWIMQAVVDTGFEKGGGALLIFFQINKFLLEFYIKKKLDKWEKSASSKSATALHTIHARLR